MKKKCFNISDATEFKITNLDGTKKATLQRVAIDSPTISTKDGEIQTSILCKTKEGAEAISKALKKNAFRIYSVVFENMKYSDIDFISVFDEGEKNEETDSI